MRAFDARLLPCSERESRFGGMGEPSSFLPLSREPYARRGRVDADAAISADAEPTEGRQGCEQPRDDFQQPLGGHVVDRESLIYSWTREMFPPLTEL